MSQTASSPIDVKTPANGDYDPLAVDAYAEHLTEVNKVKDVIASEDIRNKQGILLVKKGQQISQDVIERIVQFKLLRPLESSIDIADALDASRILNAIELLIGDEMRPTYDHYRIRAEIERCCETLFAHPILTQKLTVLSLQMPREYEKALCVAWNALLLALKMSLSPEDRVNLFIASLVHDIGMLHIPREIVEKTTPLSNDEWRAIQSHVVIGQQILKQIKGLPPVIARAVLEHHELCDGTGYPTGKFGNELSLHGQFVGLLDSNFAIYVNKLMPKQLGARRLLPVLQINSHLHHQDVSNAVIRMLRELTLPENYWSESADRPAFVKQLIAEAETLSDYYQRFERAIHALPNDNTHHSVRAARTMLGHLAILLRRSGVLDSGNLEELKHADLNDLNARVEAENAHLMLQELRWQLQRLARSLTAIIDDNKAQLATSVIEALKKEVGGLAL